MLREYQSIPQKRLACQIEEGSKVEKLRDGVARYTNKVGAIQEIMEFQYGDKKPEVGDYIVQESKTDVYLVKRELFERTYRSTGFKLK